MKKMAIIPAVVAFLYAESAEYDPAFFQWSSNVKVDSDTFPKQVQESNEPDIDSDVGYFPDDPVYRNKNRSYSNGKNGIERGYYPDGRLKYEISYCCGRKDGMEKIFYHDGKLKSETSYRDGRKDGMEKIFYPDGKLKSETNYRNGRKDGLEKTFYSDGRLRSEIVYRNGRIVEVRYRAY